MSASEIQVKVQRGQWWSWHSCFSRQYRY